MPEPGKTYRHYKGGYYAVIAIGRHTDDESLQVIYVSISNGGVWVRSLEEWNTKTKTGEDRFTLVK